MTKSGESIGAPLWIVLAAGLLVLLFAVASHADDWTAHAGRVDRFNASGKIRSLSIDNVSGDVRVASGNAFSATVQVTVHAGTKDLAERILHETKVTFANEDGDLSLVTEEPGSHTWRDGNGGWHGRRWSHENQYGSDRYRVETQYTVTLPADAALEVHSVNGGISSRGVGGDLDLSSVNGRVEVDGARHDITVKSVNGNVEATAADLPRDAGVEANTVNGSVTLWLPPRAQFDFSASTMNGGIVSTFALPPLPAPEARDAAELRQEREKIRAAQERLRREAREKARERHGNNDGEIDIDLSGLNDEMEALAHEMAAMGEEIARNVVANIHSSYRGSVNGGGAGVRCSTLNGRIAVLAAGTTVEQAKSLVPRRRAGAAVIAPIPSPRVVVRIPRPPRPPRPEMPQGESEDGSIVRGDITGDFQANLPLGDVRLGRVSGNVRVVTHSGEIRVAAAGKGADLSTSGGDVRIEAVKGDLRCVSYGGDVVAGDVHGDARLETAGGDIVLGSCTGSVIAKTGGGDIHLHGIRGSVRAETSGGSVGCQIVSPDLPAAGLSLATTGGDVTLALPADTRADVEIRVSGVDSDGDYIISEFPEVTVVRKSGGRSYGVQTATGKLNGGGPRVLIRATSGTVRLKKAPPAQ
jgi:DUF4097 and DUF4098 domain-containing protein YvlB